MIYTDQPSGQGSASIPVGEWSSHPKDVERSPKPQNSQKVTGGGTSGNNLEKLIKIVAKGGFIIFTGSIIGRILRFIFIILLSRILGASLYGLYSIGQSIIDIVTNISLLGDGRGFIRFAAVFIDNKDAPRLTGMVRGYTFVCSAISLFIAASLFLGAEYVSLRFFHNSSLTGVLKIFALSFPFYILSLIVVPIGYAFQRMEFKVIIQEVAQPLINIVAITIIFIIGGNLYGAVGGFFVTAFVTAVLGFYLLKSLYPQVLSSCECIYEIKQLVTYSLPLVGVFFCYYLLFRLDRILLGIYHTPFEVGVYSAVSNTAVGILAISGIFDACLAPALAQLYHSHKKEELKKIYACATSWGIALAFIPSVAIIIFNREITWLFGKDFSSAWFVLIIFSIACLIEIIPGQSRQLFQMSSHQNLEFANSIGMIVLNLIFNLTLIPSLGGAGAALAFLFTIIIISIIRTIQLKAIFGFLPFNSRYLKLLAHITFAIVFSLLTAASINILFKLIVATVVLLSFFWQVISSRSEEDMIIWNSFKSRVA